MTFWSTAGINPLRKYRFKVTGLLGEPVLVKSVTTPSFEIGQNSYRVLNHEMKIAGTLSWQDVTITTIANGKILKSISELMAKSGHSTISGNPTDSGGIVNSFSSNLKNKILIEMLDMDGKKASSFELFEWFIASVTYGDLDYSDDELFTVEITIAYEYANIT